MDIAEESLRHRTACARPRVSDFAHRLFAEWQRFELPQADAHVIIAVSGGADSIALLLAFDELVKTQRLAHSITVAHLDHGLRGTRSREDAEWVAEKVAQLGCEAVTVRVDVEAHAAACKDNLEQAARRARYRFLSEVAREREARFVLLGHTLDDQAETVLLRLLRGSSAEGLGGMEPVRTLEAKSQAMLIRPLLRWARRAETQEYCERRGIAVRIDEMNTDRKFMRVRVRHELIPLLKTFNPRAVEMLARTAELLREDGTTLELQATELLDRASEQQSGSAGAPPLRADLLAHEPAAVRRRALRRWIANARGHLQRVERVHLLGIEALLRSGRGGRVAELPGGCFVKRQGARLCIFVKGVEKTGGDI